MGANCCVATKEKSLPYENRFEISNHRNIRNSPSWNFRWDNRTHIEDIMDSPIRSEIKREAELETEGLSRRKAHSNNLRWQKSFIQTGTSGHFDVGVADRSTESNSSPEGKKSIKSSASATDTNPSISIPPTPASSSSRTLSLPSDPTSSVNAWQSEGYQSSRQVCDTSPRSQFQTRTDNSSPEAGQFFGVSQSGFSDAWSMSAFSELVASSSQRERWPIDNENHNSISSKEATTPDSQPPFSLSADLQTCGVCSKLLKHKPPRRICDEIPVVSVLVCGHAYHADCLESATPETDRYDPSCPVCKYGDKYKSAMIPKPELKDQDKIPGITVIDIDGATISEPEKFSKYPPLASSLSMKSNLTQPAFLAAALRPQSQLRSVSKSESSSSRKRGFWARYWRESKKSN